ncbi:hypothetical protein GCM10011428_71430 [Streptomyces violaceus]
MGMPEYEEFLDLAERYAEVRLDTTMAFTDFSEGFMPFPRRALPRLAGLGDPHSARLRLPQHSLSVRAPAPRAGAAGARRGLAAGRVPRQRGEALRSVRPAKPVGPGSGEQRRNYRRVLERSRDKAPTKGPITSLSLPFPARMS